jgi:hypothetical protein
MDGVATDMLSNPDTERVETAQRIPWSPVETTLFRLAPHKPSEEDSEP